MRRLTAMVLMGTRPEAVKMAPLIAELRRRSLWDVEVVTTGQHPQMVDPILSAFGIGPQHRLDAFSPGQSLPELSARLLGVMPEVLRHGKPDYLFVQGDTSSSFVAALCAFYEGIPVVHVEAGLRTDDPANPFPEEMNRRLISRLASIHLSPTSTAASALVRENVSRESVWVTGNTVIDALHDVVARLSPGPRSERRPGERLLLVTCHRRESWGKPLDDVGDAIARLAADRSDLRIIIPMHPNPIVRRSLVPKLESFANVDLLEPLAYLEFAAMMNESDIILTDSGGVQEEGPALGKPVLVMRENTERPEGVQAGTALLVGTDPAEIYRHVSALLDDPVAYAAMARAVNPYGDGRAAVRSVDAVEFHAGLRSRPPDEFRPGESASLSTAVTTRQRRCRES
ncbi:MAG TPA: UDP-N-acetylglucosamine 2-epimerase (non-hydrolyzing) [Nocardioides sp.]|nr:UDP-N-acetylglucosamine 2-epimerase (non-hydrolyzing) [Nocardioides sp.]